MKINDVAFTQRVDYAKGDPREPMTIEDIEAKIEKAARMYQS